MALKKLTYKNFRKPIQTRVNFPVLIHSFPYEKNHGKVVYYAAI